MQNSLYLFLALAETIAGTRCIYPWRDGRAEFARVAGLCTKAAYP